MHPFSLILKIFIRYLVTFMTKMHVKDCSTL